MKKVLAAAVVLLALLAATPAGATVSPGTAAQRVRAADYVVHNTTPNEIIHCRVLSTHRTRCRVNVRKEGWWLHETYKVDVYDGGGIDWEREYGS